MMKIYIVLKDDVEVPSDYIKVLYTAVQNLPNGICDEMYCDIIEYIPNKNIYIQTMVDKIKHGGQIVIKCADLFKICQGVTFGSLSITEAKNLLYSQKFETNTVHEIKSLLITNNFTVITQIYESEYEFIIRAEKT